MKDRNSDHTLYFHTGNFPEFVDICSLVEVLSLPHTFWSDSSGFYQIPPDSTRLHWTQCLVGHDTKFLDWAGFSVQLDSTRPKVQSSPVESTKFYQN